MTLDPVLSTSLKAIGTVMAEAHDTWWIIASAAVALHGADPRHVADVDVLLSMADAGRILPAIGVEPRPGSRHALFRSGVFATWTGTDLPVDFMADFHRREGGAWVPVRPSTRRAVQVGATTVFVPEKADLQAMLAAFGRPKDLERARSLAG